MNELIQMTTGGQDSPVVLSTVVPTQTVINRSIKLRMWDKGRKIFIPLIALALPDESTPIVQFTGLHDYFGAEIWEGDIVRWNHFDNKTGHYHEAYFEVVFRHGCFGTLGANGEDEFTPYDSIESGDVVVGSVFEHSYLLNQSLCLQW